MSDFLFVSQHINTLRETIQYHRKKYYTEEPEITDAEFDELMNQLKSWEKKHPQLVTKDSPTQTVRFAVQSQLHKKQHLVPMISLDNAYNWQDLQDWETRWKKCTSSILQEKELYVVEPKFDGLGISCVFKGGTLDYAVTRGDGSEGEEVTENIKTFLPAFTVDNNDVFEIRGEVVMKKSEFAKINQQLFSENKKPFSNPRNAAVGSLRQLDANITKQRHLSVFFYETPLLAQQNIFKNYQAVLHYFQEQNIPHPPHFFVCDTLQEAYEKIEWIGSIRSSLDFDIDGAVIKINNFALRDEIGSTNHHPRWAIAYKFAATQVSTTLEKVEWQVGRTGVLTPVAHLQAVNIDGVLVSRATLHNADYITKNDIQLHDKVIVERSGDVIPKIIMPLVAKRNGSEQKIAFPETCPVCHSEIIKKENEVAMRCQNPNCPEILKGKLLHFASKKAMNIEGLGEQIAHELVEKKLVTTLSDIFSLSETVLLQISGFQKKSAYNLSQAIAKSRQNPLWRWLAASSIPLVGEKTAKTLAKHFGTIDNIRKSDEETLTQIPEIGQKVATEIINFFKEQNNIDIFRFYKQESTAETKMGNLFANMSFVFTGTLQCMSREKAAELVEQWGGTTSNSLSANTSVLVCGSNAGSKKEKAQQLKVAIWTEEMFLQALPKTEETEKPQQETLF